MNETQEHDTPDTFRQKPAWRSSRAGTLTILSLSVLLITLVFVVADTWQFRIQVGGFIFCIALVVLAHHLKFGNKNERT